MANNGLRGRVALALALALATSVAALVRPAVAAEPAAARENVAPSSATESAGAPSPEPTDVGAGGAPTTDSVPTPDSAPTVVVAPSESVSDLQLTGTSEVAASKSYVISPSEKVDDKILLPSGQLELGGELVFVTADGLPPARSAALSADNAKVALTDLAFLRLRARRSFGKSVELFVATELLAKQPARLDEPVWQEAVAGLRAPVAKHFAFQLAGALGPTLGRSGLWWQAEPRFMYKASAGRDLRFALDLGNTFTSLALSDTRPKQTWLDELAIGAEAQLGDHSGAFWIRTDYYVPLASSGLRNGPSPLYTGNFDPQVRINLQVGGVLTISEHGWDAYAQYSWLDCGELSRPLSTLPILDGGFDQQQITLGVVHRFETERSVREAD